MIKNGAAGNAAAPKNAVQEIDAAPPQTVKPAACLTDLSASPATASDHSVLLPERFSGHAAFHLRYPVSRDSPEPHPLIVLSAWRTPESFTPSADFRRFPIGFHCRYSVITIVASYHTFPRLSTALFRSYSCVFRLIPGKSPIFPVAADVFCDFSTIFHARTNVFLYSFAGSTVSPAAALFRCGRPGQKTFAQCRGVVKLQIQK